MVLKHALRRSFADLAEKIYNININETSYSKTNMKQHYVKPEVTVEELAAESMLATSTDRIPVGDEVKPSAANDRRGNWGNLWYED